VESGETSLLGYTGYLFFECFPFVQFPSTKKQFCECPTVPYSKASSRWRKSFFFHKRTVHREMLAFGDGDERKESTAEDQQLACGEQKFWKDKLNGDIMCPEPVLFEGNSAMPSFASSSSSSSSSSSLSLFSNPAVSSSSLSSSKERPIQIVDRAMPQLRRAQIIAPSSLQFGLPKGPEESGGELIIPPTQVKPTSHAVLHEFWVRKSKLNLIVPEGPSCLPLARIKRIARSFLPQETRMNFSANSVELMRVMLEMLIKDLALMAWHAANCSKTFHLKERHIAEGALLDEKFDFLNDYFRLKSRQEPLPPLEPSPFPTSFPQEEADDEHPQSHE